MKSISFVPTTTGKTVGIVKLTRQQQGIVKWIISEVPYSNGKWYQIFASTDNGYSGKLIPKIDLCTDESCYHESLDLAKKWIYTKEFESQSHLRVVK